MKSQVRHPCMNFEAVQADGQPDVRVVITTPATSTTTWAAKAHAPAAGGLLDDPRRGQVGGSFWLRIILNPCGASQCPLIAAMRYAGIPGAPQVSRAAKNTGPSAEAHSPAIRRRECPCAFISTGAHTRSLGIPAVVAATSLIWPTQRAGSGMRPCRVTRSIDRSPER